MKKLLILTAILLACTMLFSVPEFNKQNFYENKLIVCFQADVIRDSDGKINFTREDGIVRTGISEFDLIAKEYEISGMEQMFPRVKNKAWRNRDGAGLQYVYRLTLTSNENIEETLSVLEKSGILHYVEYETIMRYCYTPNDSLFNEQWFHQNIHSEDAWDYMNSDNEVLVAISDSGVKWNHTDLQDNIWVNEAELDESMAINWEYGIVSGGNGIDDDGNGYIDDVIGWCFAEGDEGNDSFQPVPANTHGTHVAGCAGAIGDNEEGVVGSFGSFPNIKLIPIRHASNMFPTTYIENGASGIIYAADVGADIVNCSWGGMGGYELLQQAVDYAADAGTLVIAAAGNNMMNHHPNGTFFPADCENVFTVAATDMNDNVTMFSDYGPQIDIAAPGVEILSTVIMGSNSIPNGYELMDGTSMASPIVAGIAAMIKAVNPNFGPTEIKQRLMETADNIDELNPNHVGLLGAGRINSVAALLVETGTIEGNVSYLVDGC